MTPRANHPPDGSTHGQGHHPGPGGPRLFRLPVPATNRPALNGLYRRAGGPLERLLGVDPLTGWTRGERPHPDPGGPRLFRLPVPPPNRPGLTGLYRRAVGPLERLLAVDRLNDVYDRCAGAGGLEAFLRRVLGVLEISYSV